MQYYQWQLISSATTIEVNGGCNNDNKRFLDMNVSFITDCYKIFRHRLKISWNMWGGTGDERRLLD